MDGGRSTQVYAPWAAWTAAAVLGVAFMAQGGCGGASSLRTNSDGGSGSGGAGSSRGPQGALVAACPAAPPSFGTACSAIGQLCEYGDDVNSRCNVAAHCSLEGRWQDALYGYGTGCPTSIDACPSEPEGACQNGGERCEIDTGVCTCTDVPTAPGQETGLFWRCGAPPSACPPWPARPRIGSPCSVPETICDYAPCASYGFAFRCSPAGYWTDAIVPCTS